MQKNAIILAAGTSTRFVPLSWEYPKGLLEVKGEILIERQIRQLKEAGIDDITVIVGYMAEKFEYLKDKFGVITVYNEDFERYNNISSLIKVIERLGDTYICSSDNYFQNNVFKEQPTGSFYSALYAKGNTSEYCLETNTDDEITGVSVGGHDSWYMVGHAFFSQEFSNRFKRILEQEYRQEATRKGYWEDVYIRYIDRMPPMKAKHYEKGDIQEFDTLEDLRNFDESYLDDTRSETIRTLAERMGCRQSRLRNFSVISNCCDGQAFSFEKDNVRYRYINGLIMNADEESSDMTDPETLLRHMRQIFPTRDLDNASFERIGGMSNKNFRVTIDGESYVLRIPGNGSEGMVERLNEEFNAIQACRLGITPPVRYFNPITGIKLTDFIVNAETLTSATIQRRDNMLKIAKLYKKLHGSGKKLRNEFNIFREIEKYDRLIEKAGAEMYAGWESLRTEVMNLESHLKSLGTELKACHNDALYENFIKASDGTIYLIDWEYSGMNDPIADFAALFLEASFEKENEEYILEKYFDGEIPTAARKKILCFQVLWDYLWAQWTVIKEAKGDDFGSYGIDRFNRAIKNIKRIK